MLAGLKQVKPATLFWRIHLFEVVQSYTFDFKASLHELRSCLVKNGLVFAETIKHPIVLIDDALSLYGELIQLLDKFLNVARVSH